MRRLAPLLAFVLLAPAAPGCHQDDSLLRAKRIEVRSELVGGPVAMADVGDFLLENDQIRIAILGAKDSPAPGVFGGSVVDVDLRRDRLGFEGGQGRDRFAETFPLANLLVPDPTSVDVKVLRDGSDGREAAIRVEGDGQFMFEALSILRSQKAGLDLVYPNVISSLRFRTDYVLHPGERHLTIHTEILLGDDPPQGCPEISSCGTTCEHGHAQDAGGCLVCACSSALPLDGATGPINVFGTALGDPVSADQPPPVKRAGIVAGDFVFFGNQNDVFAPGPGFDEDATVQDGVIRRQNSFEQPFAFDFVAAAGGDVSYGYFTVGAPGAAPPVVDVPLFASAATSFLTGSKSCLVDTSDDAACDSQRAFSYTRYLAVGDGDVASVVDEALHVRGAKVGGVRGHVYWQSTGEPAKKARLFVFADPDPGRTWSSVDALVRANQDARGDVGLVDAIDADVGLDRVLDGDFAATLPRGRYVLVARDADGTATSVPVSLNVHHTGDEVVQLQLPPPATVHYRVTDGAGLALPAKLSFVSVTSKGKRLEGDGLRRPYMGEGRLGGGARALAFTASGEGDVAIEPGRYHVVVSHGVEYGLHEEDIEVGAGQLATVDAVLAHQVDTSGWASTDMHLHSRPSFDSGMQLERRVTAVAAEGVDLAISTDHDVETDYGPVIKQLRLETQLATAVGAEITTLEQGHFIGFPLRYDELAVPTHGAHDWTCEAGGEILDGIRGTGDGMKPFTIVAHPRDGFFGYVDQLGVDGFTMNRKPPLLEQTNPIFRTASCDFDGMEVINGKRFDLLRTPTVAEMTDWNRCEARVLAAADPAALDAACPELPGWPLVSCEAKERFEDCKRRHRSALAWATTKRILVRTPEEQAANWHFAGSMADSQALCDPKLVGDAPIGPEVAAQPCSYRPGHVDDFFRYLEHGMVRTQVGSSDSHGNNREPGIPRTYFRSASDSPTGISIVDAVSALRGGHALAVDGAFVRADIGGKTFGETTSASPGDSVALHLDIQSADWFGVDRVEVYMNGDLVKELSPHEGPEAIVDLHGKVTLKVPDRDSWVVVIAMGLSDGYTLEKGALAVPFGEVQLSKVASDAFGHLPFIDTLFSAPPTLPDWSPTPVYTLTNPIFVDVGGDGRYDAPLPMPDFCSRGCDPAGDDASQCPAGQTCLDDERVCGFLIGGACNHRRLAPPHED